MKEKLACKQGQDVMKIAEKLGSRLRELAPAARGGITQPRSRHIDHLCTALPCFGVIEGLSCVIVQLGRYGLAAALGQHCP